MMLPSAAIVGLLLQFAGRTLAFSPSIAGSLSPSPRARFPALRANEYDVWWQEHRARNTLTGNQVSAHMAASKATSAAYDTGTAAGRAALRAAKAEAANAAAQAAAVPGAAKATGMPDALQLDENFWWTNDMLSSEDGYWYPPPSSSVAHVLITFVQSDYARTVFNYRSAAGTDYGRLGGMFDYVRLVDNRLELKVKQSFQNVQGLFDRLSKYIRARIPQIKEIHEMHRDGMTIH